MTHMKVDSTCVQSPHPAAQQRRGLEVQRKYATGTADEGFHSQAARPRAHRGRIELCKPARDFIAARAVACDESWRFFRMGEIEPTLAGDKKLAPDRAEAFVQMHFGPGRARDFRRHQSRR